MDKNLWKEIIETVIPLKKKEGRFGRVESSLPKLNVKNAKSGNEGRADVEVSFVTADDVKVLKCRHILEADVALGDASRVDKNLIKNFRRGNFSIDARLDLHGKTLEKAYATFIAFVNENYERANRYLLVVTGKGNPEKNTGVIRKNFPLWLNDESVRDKILYVNFANISDGGDGAFYILLRRQKFE